MKIHSKVPTWEIAVLALLLLGVIYYFVIQQPVQNDTDSINSEKSQVQSEIDTYQTLLLQKQMMQKKIDELMEEYDGNPPELPIYNNMKSIVNELNLILGDTDTYSVQFGSIDRSDNVIRQPISIEFECENYDTTMEKLRAIRDSLNTYLIVDLSMKESTKSRQTGTNTGSIIDVVEGNTDYASEEYQVYRVSMQVTAFEYASSEKTEE